MDYYEHLRRKYSAIQRQQNAISASAFLNDYFDYTCDPVDTKLMGEKGNEIHKFFVKRKKAS